MLEGIKMVWGCSSAGEHFVDIEGVTGSIPVTPTIYQGIVISLLISYTKIFSLVFGEFHLKICHKILKKRLIQLKEIPSNKSSSCAIIRV